VERFASREHHFHEPGTAAASCIACHMPSRIYMGVDERHDHSFRVPRPDLSVSLGTPNACNDCHVEETPEWAAEAFAGWYGDPGSHYGQAFFAARRDLPEARGLLVAVAADSTQPAIVRATAVAELRGRLGPESVAVIQSALTDSSPLVREAALGTVETVQPRARLALAQPLLDDPVLAVRIEAARVLAEIPDEVLDDAAVFDLEMALDAYDSAQRTLAELPQAHLNRGLVRTARGDSAAAARAYRTAIRLDSTYTAAYVNLADLYRATDRDSLGEVMLRKAITLAPEDAGARHALGLFLVRAGRSAEAMVELERAATLAPDLPRYAYTYGIALNSAGDVDHALEVLDAGHRLHPTNRDLLFALIGVARDSGWQEGALDYARKLVAIAPDDPQAHQLLRSLEAP
jgi:tetratricopeptide (TPR) repeat protein